MEQKIEKMFFFIFQIVAFDLEVADFHHVEQNTWYR